MNLNTFGTYSPFLFFNYFVLFYFYHELERKEFILQWEVR